MPGGDAVLRAGEGVRNVETYGEGVLFRRVVVDFDRAGILTQGVALVSVEVAQVVANDIRTPWPGPRENDGSRHAWKRDGSHHRLHGRRKIRALCLGHYRDKEYRHGDNLANAFVVYEIEELVFDDRAAYVAAKLIEAQRGGQSCKVVLCVHRVIAEIIEGRAVNGVAAGLGDDVHDIPG